MTISLNKGKKGLAIRCYMCSRYQEFKMFIVRSDYMLQTTDIHISQSPREKN